MTLETAVMLASLRASHLKYLAFNLVQPAYVRPHALLKNERVN